VKNGWCFLACVLAAAGCLHAQSERCPFLAKLPADLKDYEALEDRPWLSFGNAREKRLL
jgi:hypothetical protein